MLKWLASGYAVGIVCMLYLMARSWAAATVVVHGAGRTLHRSKTRESWLGMALLSTGVSLAWTVVGAGIYHLLDNRALFIQFSLAVALAVAVFLTFKKTPGKLDKIMLSAIVVLGQGLLIPYMFQ
jgi:hypothetical protein